MPVEGRERSGSGDMLNNSFNDAGGRLPDPDHVGVGTEFGGSIVVDREQGDSASGPPHQPDQSVVTFWVAVVHHDDGAGTGSRQFIDDAGQRPAGHFGLHRVHHQIAQQPTGRRVTASPAQGLKTEPGLAHTREAHYTEERARLGQSLPDRASQEGQPLVFDPGNLMLASASTVAPRGEQARAPSPTFS